MVHAKLWTYHGVFGYIFRHLPVTDVHQLYLGISHFGMILRVLLTEVICHVGGVGAIARNFLFALFACWHLILQDLAVCVFWVTKKVP